MWQCVFLKPINSVFSRGGEPIVHDISFSVEGGQVVGLIGPNGSGKSTTLGGILGLYPIHGGSFVLNGNVFNNRSPLSPEAKSQIAIPEQPMYYSDLTLLEHLYWKQRLWHALPVSSETTITSASLCSDSPIAALCLVPSFDSVFGLLDTGNTLLAETIRLD